MATKKGSDQPKGAKSAYIFFSMATRSIISQANPDMKPTEVSKVLGEQWKCLDEKQKAKYSKMAEEDKIRYKEECEAFIQSGGEMKKRTTKSRASMAQAELPPLKIKVNAPEKKNKTKQKSNNTDPEMLDSPDLFEAQTHSGNHFLSAQIPNKEEIKDDESEASFFSAQSQPTQSSIKKEIQDDESEASVAAGEYIQEVALAEAMVSPVWPGQASLPKVLSDSKDSGFKCKEEPDKNSNLKGRKSLMSQRMEKKYPTKSTEKLKKEKISPSKSSEKGPIIASEWLKFVTSWDKAQDRLVLPNQENCNLQKFKFQVEFGIRAEDQNIYRFTLSLMSLKHDPSHDLEYYGHPGRDNEENCSCSYCQGEWEETPRLRELSAPELGDKPDPKNPLHGYYLILWSEDKNISVDTVVCINGKNAKKIYENNYDEQYSEKQGYRFFKVDKYFEIIDESEIAEARAFNERAFSSESDESMDSEKFYMSPNAPNRQQTREGVRLELNSPTIEIKIEISASNKKSKKSPMLSFNDSKEGFKIGCKGSKMYYVDKAVIAKESNNFKNLSKNTSQLILDDVDSITLETFLIYCYSGYIPYASVDKALAIFVEKYNVTSLKDLMDRYLSLTLTGKTAKNWIPWAIKLKMENTALRIYQMRAEAKEAWAKVLELETILFSNNFSFAQLQVEENFVDFSNFIETLRANGKDLYPSYGKFLELDSSENIMFN